MQSMVPETMAASMAYVETLIEGTFLFGDEPTLADCWLYPLLTFLPGDGVDIEAYPKAAALKAAWERRASVQAVIAMGMLR